MDFEKLKIYCLSKKGAYEDFPFDSSTLTFRVSGKMFALTDIDKMPMYVNLKCDPYLSIFLREEHEGVTPGYHMNKKHWNTVILDGGIPDEKICWMIDMSYELVLKGLSKKDREVLLKK
ncbi:hypothetical protein OXPF_20110 [Oxobacter pfennigii]|uniref:MmcQ-like protein n=1 Tax=Oxobacter pfennigii TaxID=36849 RepID=A0A0N8NTB8_9CLOT|nr:MmcQ/YjbR family DNA-binding protein [Oxobacter pfennigii]KPU44392.1 hypothetical protein OXPF_20110 [Oxobacter pfennigii]